MTWVNLSSAFGYGTKLTSQQQQQLRDNIKAAFDGDANAPNLLTHPIWIGGEVEHESTIQTYADIAISVFRKKAGMETVRAYLLIKRSVSTRAEARLVINGVGSSLVSTTSGYAIYATGTIDVSGLGNDTSYQMSIQLRKGDSDSGSAWLWGFAVYLE